MSIPAKIPASWQRLAKALPKQKSLQRFLLLWIQTRIGTAGHLKLRVCNLTVWLGQLGRRLRKFPSECFSGKRWLPRSNRWALQRSDKWRMHRVHQMAVGFGESSLRRIRNRNIPIESIFAHSYDWTLGAKTYEHFPLVASASIFRLSSSSPCAA